MVRKVTRYIFTYLGAVFLMSYIIFSNNVGAVSYLTSLIPVKDLVRQNLYFQDSKSTTWTQGTSWKNYSNNATNGSSYFTLSNSGRNFTMSQGQFALITGSFYATANYQMEHNTSGMMYIGNASRDCNIIELNIDDEYADNTTGNQTITYRANFNILCKASAAISTGPTINLYLEGVTNSGVTSYGISFTSLYVFSQDISLATLRNSVNDILTYLQNNPGDNAGATLQQEKQDVQDASDDSETAGEDSSSDAETATSSLMSVISGFVGVITSAQPTNCKLNGNINHINIGQLDLCSLPVPSYFGIIGTFILIGLCIPLAISLFNRFIGLFRSFQQ